MEQVNVSNLLASGDLATLLADIYGRAYQKGRADLQAEIQEARKRRAAYYAAGQDAGKIALDEALRDKRVKSEFDRRVGKALDTARANWEAQQSTAIGSSEVVVAADYAVSEGHENE